MKRFVKLSVMMFLISVLSSCWTSYVFSTEIHLEKLKIVHVMYIKDKFRGE